MQERKAQNNRIIDLIHAGEKRLSASGIETARLEVELIWAHVLKTPQIRLHTEPHFVPDQRDVEEVNRLIARRAKREPLQHILGEEEFYGLKFIVNPDVLIPRPETELLVEQAIQFLQDRDEPMVFDFGTGSGCIPVVIAHELPGVRVATVDLSERATEVAKQNAERNGCSARITFLGGDGFSALTGEDRFDLIVSNPPYIPTEDLEGLQTEVRDFDPRLALDGGVDGLDFYRRLAGDSKRWLKPGGKVMLELGHDQSTAVRELFENEMWIVERVIEDYSRIPRILIAHAVNAEAGGR